MSTDAPHPEPPVPTEPASPPTDTGPTADAPTPPDRIRGWRRWLAPYLALDPRALGLFRIGFGLLALWDVLYRMPVLRQFYTDDGVVPGHFMLFRGASEFRFSLLLAFTRPEEVFLFFLLTAVCICFFIVGYRTKLFHVLAAIGVLSIHARNTQVENGGDVVLNLWWLWTLFLPLGRRFSIDAVRASMRARPDRTAAELNAPVPRDRRLAWSLAALAVLLQLSLIYTFNTVHKNGNTWMDGSALAWVLEQDRIATVPGLWVRDHLPLWFLTWSTYATLVIEGAAPILFLTPIGTVWARRIAIVSLSGLHGGIWLLTDVRLFSPAMMVSYLLLLSARDIALLKALLARLAGPPVHVLYDSGCGVCTWLARLCSRLDVLGRITWVDRSPDGPLPDGWTRAQLEAAQDETLLAWTPGRGAPHTRHRAVAATLDALPLGRLLSWPLKVPGLSALKGRAYDAFARRRHAVSDALGMGICGLTPPPAVGPADEPPRARVAAGRFAFWLGQGCVVVALLATGSQALVENQWLARRIKHKQPMWAKAIVGYGRFYQGWSMFAPNSPQTDGCLVIAATLADGTVVDPQDGKPPEYRVCDRRLLSHEKLWKTYAGRIATRRAAEYRPFLRDWLLRPGPRMALPADAEVTAVTVTWIGDRSPKPGSGALPAEFERYEIARGVARVKRKR